MPPPLQLSDLAGRTPQQPISHFMKLALENPGLITFAQRVNLAKPGTDTPQFMRRAAAVEAHEFAHLWFGDLVGVRRRGSRRVDAAAVREHSALDGAGYFPHDRVYGRHGRDGKHRP